MDIMESSFESGSVQQIKKAKYQRNKNSYEYL